MSGTITAEPLVGRRRIIDEVRTRLVEGQGGAMLIGESGIGKTALAQHVLDTLAADVYVVHIRGSAVSTKTAYGALAFLLSELDDDALSHPALLLHGLTRILRQQAGETPIVLFVDNADEVDGLAATVITQLVRAGTASLLLTASDGAAAGDDMLHLWIDGHLERFDLGPLGFDDAMTLVRQTLGGRVSASAARALWQTTGGNPHFLRVMAHEQAALGSLVRQDDIWVLARPVAPGAEIADVVRSRIQRLTASRRRLMEILSFVGELPLDLMRTLGDAADIDALEELGSLEVLFSPFPAVRIRNRLTADVIRATVPIGRSRELWDEVTDRIDVDKISSAAVMGFASWALMSGSTLSPDTALRAARTANQLQEPDQALRHLRAASPKGADPEILLEEARAHRGLGDSDAARAALQRISPEPEDPDLLIPLLIERARIQASLADPDEDPSALLARGRTVLAGRREEPGDEAPWAIDSDSIPLADQVSLAMAELASFEGRFKDSAAEAESVFSDPARDENVRLIAGSLLCEAWAHTGRQQEAMDLAQRLETRLAAPRLRDSAKAVASPRIFMAFLLAGMFSTCRSLLDTPGIQGLHGAGADGELSAGLVHLLCGRSDDAVDSLVSAVSQLKVRDSDGALGVAQAALAHAFTLQGERARAQRTLTAIPHAGRRIRWDMARYQEYCRLMASAGHLPAKTIAAELLARAEEDEIAGNTSMALLFLAAAARLGDSDGVPRLEQLAGQGQGPLADLCGTFAIGLAHHDGTLLLQAARLARDTGNSLFCHEAARRAHTAAAEGQDRATMREARRLENLSYRDLRHENSISHRIGQLADFELTLARRAASGETSAAIGKSLHLSPRTVDWHLGRIFEKLHVSGRAELREALT